MQHEQVETLNVLISHNPDHQWAVDRLLAEFGNSVWLSEPTPCGGQHVGVVLEGRPAHGRFLQCPKDVGESAFKTITPAILDSLIQSIRAPI